MKKLASLVAALTLGASLPAQTPDLAPAAKPYSITVDFPYTQAYVFRGIEYAENSLQPSVKFTTGNFYAGVWANTPLDRGYELEVDYFAGYNFKLSERWSLDAGGTLYTYPGLDTPGADKTTFEAYLGLNGTLGVVNSGTYAYYDTTLKAFTAQQTFGYTIASDARTTFNLLATVGHVKPDAGSSYTFFGAGVVVGIKLFEGASLNFGGQYAGHDMHQIDDTHFWGTVGLSYTY